MCVDTDTCHVRQGHVTPSGVVFKALQGHPHHHGKAPLAGKYSVRFYRERMQGRLNEIPLLDTHFPWKFFFFFLMHNSNRNPVLPGRSDKNWKQQVSNSYIIKMQSLQQILRQTSSSFPEGPVTTPDKPLPALYLPDPRPCPRSRGHSDASLKCARIKKSHAFLKARVHS